MNDLMTRRAQREFDAAAEAHTAPGPVPVASAGPALIRSSAPLARLHALINSCGDMRVSDMHIHPGKPVRRLKSGKLVMDEGPTGIFSAEDIDAWLTDATEGVDSPLEPRGHASVAMATDRYRVRGTFRKSLAGITVTFRLIPTEIPNADDIGVPQVIQDLIHKDSGLIIMEGPTGSGKALALDTPIPTPTGWTTMGQLDVGHEVFGRDGSVCRVTSLSEIKMNPDLYRVQFSDGQVIHADEEHQWLVSTHHSRNHGRTKGRRAAIERLEKRLKRADAIEALGASALYMGQELTSNELYEIIARHGLAGEWNSSHVVYQSLHMVDCPKRSVVREMVSAGGVPRSSRVNVYLFEDAMAHLAVRIRQQRAHGFDIGPEQVRMSTGEIMAAGVRLGANSYANFATPVAEPLDLPEADLRLDPWLLGLWLGDGASDRGLISSHEESGDMAHVRGRIHALGFETTPIGDGVSFKVKGLRDLLREIGVLGNKRIPSAYLRASAEQRMAVLQGIMDSDGTVDKNGNSALALSDRPLFDDSVELIRSLGIKASATYDRPSSYTTDEGDRVDCKPHHLACFTTAQTVFTLPRKVDRLPRTVREAQKWVYITAIEKIDPAPVRCITVDSDDHTYLCGTGFISTSNTTAIAGLLKKVNTEYDKHIYMVEDPTEFVHEEIGATSIIQRQIGTHALDYPTAIEDALRSKPNVIVIGELLNAATAKAALHAATTGHLVITTAHAGSITEALDSFIGQFSADEQPQVRSRLSQSLLAIMVQKLVPAVDGRLQAAREVLINNLNFTELIRDEKAHIIRGQIAGDKQSFTLESSLLELVRDGKITCEVALAAAKVPIDLRNDLKRAGLYTAEMGQSA